MKKVMLISPPEKLVLSEAGDRPNLGILYLASSLRENGHQAKISDLNHDSYYTLNKKIENMSPDFIGMTSVSAYSGWVKDHANYLKQRFPKTELMVGGPHATGLPEDLIDNFDYVVRGEGEQAIIDVVEGRVGKGIINAPFIRNLKQLSNPARDLLPLDERYGIKRSFGKRGTLMDTSRGCLGDCFFCTKFLRGNGIRFYSLEKTLEQMEEIQNAGFDWIYFTDDCFSANNKRTTRLMDEMSKRNIDLKFQAMTRTDCVDEPLLEKMRENGLSALLYGIEHMDNKVLSSINHKNNTEQNKKAVVMSKDLGILVTGTFILNLPGATEKTMYECLDFAVDSELDSAMFFGLQSYPGTPLWKNPEKFGYSITSKNINSPLSSDGETNVTSKSMPKEKAEIIIKDIKQKWKNYKGTNIPWAQLDKK